MSHSPLSFLQHILNETNYILSHSKSLTKDQFLNDETLKRAFARSIEIIGEAAKQLPDDFRQTYPDIEWRIIGRMRDKLIHHYFGIDYELIWDVITSKVPKLHDYVSNILRKEDI